MYVCILFINILYIHTVRAPFGSFKFVQKFSSYNYGQALLRIFLSKEKKKKKEKKKIIVDELLNV